MKVSVIGNGNVGMAVFANLQNIGGISELTMVGRYVDKIRGEVDDYKDAQVLDFYQYPKLSYGKYADVAGSDIIIYTAGAGQKPGQDRLELVKMNAEITRQIFTEIKPLIKDAIVICLSNPVDVLTYVIKEVTGLDDSRVMGSGTLLDTARLRRFIASLFDISPSSVDALAIAEHGMSAVVLWSAVRIANYDIDSYSKLVIDSEVSMKKTLMDQYMKKVAYKLIDAKGSTAYGVANATARIVKAILFDSNESMPVSTVMLDKYGVSKCAISVPVIMGKNGIVDSVLVNMTDSERKQFDDSVATVSKTINSCFE